jgi:hypothetical protein
VIAELTAVRGIGRWTAEMFLIFNQMRPDVFPLDDIGLQRAVFERYFAGEKQSRRCLAPLANAGAPGVRWPPGICGAASIRCRLSIEPLAFRPLG